MKLFGTCKEWSRHGKDSWSACVGGHENHNKGVGCRKETAKRVEKEFTDMDTRSKEPHVVCNLGLLMHRTGEGMSLPFTSQEMKHNVNICRGICFQSIALKSYPTKLKGRPTQVGWRGNGGREGGEG
jgi:hypothetical protein